MNKHIEKIVDIDPNEIIPYINNAKIHDEKQVDMIISSIREFGFTNPCLVDENNNLIAGHGRLLAAKKMNLEKIPCIVLEGLSEAQRKALILADNRIAEMAKWDDELLKLELENLNDLDFDMSSIGIDFDDLIEEENEEKEEEPSTTEDDFDFDAVIPERTKDGDVWKLGRHRLMCGDSTSQTAIDTLTDGHIMDLVFTDPPYGMKKEKDGVLNDNLNSNDLLEFNKKWIPLTFNALKDMGAWYCWGIDEPLFDIYQFILKPEIRKNRMIFRNYITWAKHSAIGLKSPKMLSYPRETEKCLFVVKGQDWNNNNAEFFNTKYEKVLEYLKGEADKVGLTPKELHRLTGVHGHWFTKSQFTVIPERHYLTLQKAFNSHGVFLKSHTEVRDLIGITNEGKRPEKPYCDITWFDDGDMPLSDVWRQSVTSSSERKLTGGHATPKPLSLCERAIRTSSRENENVLDVFGGSGSTLIACEQLNRNCFMMELDPKYCDVIINRWEVITGEKAVLLEKEE